LNQASRLARVSNKDITLSYTECSHGEHIEIAEIFEKSSPRYNRLEIEVYDPKTEQEIKHHSVDLVELDNPDLDISKIVVLKKLFDYELSPK
jgi:hypothetical protein